MPESMEEWVPRMWDSIGIHLKDGLIAEATREALLVKAEKDIAAGLLAPPNQRAALKHSIRIHGDRIRKRRTRDLPEALHRVQDVLTGMTILPAAVDPFLDQMYPTGDTHGLDKSLRYWTRLDWLRAYKVRREQADESAAAAAEFERRVHVVVAVMDAGGWDETGEAMKARSSVATT